MHIAANLTLLFTERPLRERVVAAAAAGFDGVEIQFPYELPAMQLREALAAAGLPLVLINVPAGDLLEGGPGLAAVPACQAAFDAALEQALTYAAMVRPRCINILPGRLAAGVSHERAMATLVANLRKAADAFALLGIRLVSEALNPLDLPGSLVGSAQQLLELVIAVDHPNFAVQLDFYHMARQGLDVTEAVRLLAGRIGHVQFADCPGRHQPGTGTLDFAAALQALHASGYSGWLGAEYRPTGATLDSLAWLGEWRAHYADGYRNAD